MKRFFQPASVTASASDSASTLASLKQGRIEINLSNLECDPGVRRKLSSFHPNDQDKVRRYYWEKGPVLDMQLQELNNCFNEASTELLTCMVSLSPDNEFSSFDKDKLIRLACLYPNDFSELQRAVLLGDQLDTYIFDVQFNDEFMSLKGLGSLAQKMVETKRDKVYPLVYRLLKLALVLPVATATVERVFSAMKIVKNRLCNRMGDDFLNDSLLVYIERGTFNSISNEAIMQCFQKMKNRRQQL